MSDRRTDTPLMKQYYLIKDEYPGTILLFRIGDFYEAFADDAETLSKELGITLTRRNNAGDQTPLAGFPHHALESYLPKLVRLGYRVAVCDQREEPSEAKARGSKVVDRQVTEVVTPGVTMSDNVLEQKRNNYICAIHGKGDSFGLAFSDISTGEFALCDIDRSELPALIHSIQPAEVLVSASWKKQLPEVLHDYVVTWLEEWVFEGDYGYNLLLDHFNTHSLKGFGVEQLQTAQVAAGALLHYVRENQKGAVSQLSRLYAFDHSEYIMLDAATKRNLELTASMQEGGREGTLISILDDTCTAMGGRLLRQWIMRPLKDIDRINWRLNAVETLNTDHSLRQQLREELSGVGDIERIISKICTGRANARDVIQLRHSLERIPGIAALIGERDEELFQHVHRELHPLQELRDQIGQAIVEDPPAGLREGGMFKDGYSEELAEVRDIARNGKDYVARIQKQLSEETDIPSLKLGYNKVFGYYIEVTNAHKEKVPEHFIRKQTLVNAERYITPELKEIEEKILSAEERMHTLEYELFRNLLDEVAGHAAAIQQNAHSLARLDCLQSLAEVAYRYNYCKPSITGRQSLDIRDGRHPVVERSLPQGEPFIPNDLYLDNEEQQIMIITGPNMAGKSIVLRQCGLIVLLAQAGSFVPAREATVSAVDKIFTRVGASDNLTAGESTFLVEMNEAANILNNATPRSLILLDEVGRGTSTFDGISIAWALAEYLHNQPSVAAKTLFATHYHELNELESMYERIANYNVQVREHEGKVIFLRKLARGGADHSYGIQVADMAGLPTLVIERAREILENLESQSLDLTDASGTLVKGAQKKRQARQAARSVPPQEEIPQLSLFSSQVDPNLETVRNKLQGCDPNRMTPIESLLMLSELKKLVEKGGT